MISFRSASALLFVPAAFVLAFSACNTTPTPVGIGIRGSGATKIMDRSPIDIAVVPVVNSAGKGVPTSVLRGSFQQGLVARRYSPLALEYVDRDVVNAAFTPDSTPGQAVMTISIERWDANVWETHNALHVKLQVSIADADSAELWSGSVDQRFEFGSALEPLATQSAKLQYACDVIAAEVLQKLPMRDAGRVPGS